MGNCLVIQDRKEIKIMEMDSEILKLPSPLKVQEALAEFPPGHSISDALPEQQHLDPAADMAVGRLYHLFPVKAPAVADPGVVRVKLVISKQELKKMLTKEDISLDVMVQLMRKEASDRESKQECCRGWQPALESIPEGSDF